MGRPLHALFAARHAAVEHRNAAVERDRGGTDLHSRRCDTQRSRVHLQRVHLHVGDQIVVEDPLHGASLTAPRQAHPRSRLLALFSTVLLTTSGVMSIATLLLATGHLEALARVLPHDSEPARSDIPNPAFSVPASYRLDCWDIPIDDSPRCLGAALDAINARRHAEGVRPMVVPQGFARWTLGRQLTFAVDSERTARGLPAVHIGSGGLAGPAIAGARAGADPLVPVRGFRVSYSEWVGGAANGLDADYLFMYDDGPHGDNLQCSSGTEPACWAHRDGLLADYGTGVLRIAVASHADSSSTSTAVVLGER